MAGTGQIRALNMLSPEVPLEETPWADDTRYIWVDKNDLQVSHAFYDFPQALKWRMGWEKRKERVERRLADYQRQHVDHPEHGYYQRGIETAELELQGLSHSGKPPAQLKRIIIRASVEKLTKAERDVLKGILAANA